MLKLLVEWTLLAFGLEIAHRVFREISIISGAEYFINLNDYFNFHVCQSMLVFPYLCVRMLALIPAVV